MRRVSLARICWLSIELSFRTVEAWLAMLPAAAAAAAEGKERRGSSSSDARCCRGRLMFFVLSLSMVMDIRNIHTHTNVSSPSLSLSLFRSPWRVYIYIPTRRGGQLKYIDFPANLA